MKIFQPDKSMDLSRWKWADYLISAVKYDKSKTRVEEVAVHIDYREKLSLQPFILTRRALIEKLEAGKTFVTIVMVDDDWRKRKKVRLKRKGNETLIGNLET